MAASLPAGSCPVRATVLSRPSSNLSPSPSRPHRLCRGPGGALYPQIPQHKDGSILGTVWLIWGMLELDGGRRGGCGFAWVLCALGCRDPHMHGCSVCWDAGSPPCMGALCRGVQRPPPCMGALCPGVQGTPLAQWSGRSGEGAGAGAGGRGRCGAEFAGLASNRFEPGLQRDLG